MEFPSSKIENFLIFQEMERSCFKIKKFQEMEVSCLIFFLYFRKELSELKKLKKDPLEKNSDSFGEWNFLATNLKNSYIPGGNFKVTSFLFSKSF